METIDLTPTWKQILPALLLILDRGSKQGRDSAIEELNRMAEAADAWNESVRNARPLDPFDSASAAKEQRNG